MFFSDKGLRKLEDVRFPCFPSLTVLKLSTDFASTQELDLRGLKHLKSLELESSSDTATSSQILISLGSLLKLGFLRWLNIPTNSPCIDEIGRLTNLQVLDLDGCVRFSDLSSLIYLRVACFRDNDSIRTITGLSSNHTNLQFLNLSWCLKLQSCLGVGELVALQELHLDGCSKLTEVPNLQKLKRLRKLDVSYCRLLRALLGLGDLVSLVELHARWCVSLAALPDLRKLRNLRILDLEDCELIKSLPGLNELVCLQSLKMPGCTNLTQQPDMYKLAHLQTLEWDPYRPLQSAAGLSDLISLRSLIVGIDELHEVPDLRKLTNLKRLHVAGWQGPGFSSLAELVLLESVIVRGCKGVRAVPDLERLSKLYNLEFWSCEFEDLINLTNLEVLKVRDCDKLEAFPDLRELSRLENLEVENCARLRDLRGILALRNLKVFLANGHPWLHENLGPDFPRLTGLRILHVCNGGFADLQGLPTYSQLWILECSGCLIRELPDLANFPMLLSLNVQDCVNLTKLTCTGPLSPELACLSVYGCTRLQALPDFTNARKMHTLDVSNSGVLSAQLIQDMKARWP